MINWILVISGIIGAVGFWAYVLEVLQNRVGRYTTWKELNHYQMELAVLTIAGWTTFLGTLIAAAILK